MPFFAGPVCPSSTPNCSRLPPAILLIPSQPIFPTGSPLDYLGSGPFPPFFPFFAVVISASVVVPVFHFYFLLIPPLFFCPSDLIHETLDNNCLPDVFFPRFFRLFFWSDRWTENSKSFIFLHCLGRSGQPFRVCNLTF